MKNFIAVYASFAVFAQAQATGFGPTVYSSGVTKGTVFPSLETYCRDVSSGAETHLYSVPYDTFVGQTPFIGNVQGSLVGCHENLLTLTGYFTDISFFQDGKIKEKCSGTIVLQQDLTKGKMKVSWVVSDAADSDLPCGSLGKSFKVNLNAKSASELTFPQMTSVEHDLVNRLDGYFSWKLNKSIVLDSSVGEDDKSYPIAKGGVVQKTHCDRGGADWPEAGVCYQVLPNGQARAYLKSVETGATGWANMDRARYSWIFPQ